MTPRSRPAALATILALALVPLGLGWASRPAGAEVCAAPVEVVPEAEGRQPTWLRPWRVRCDGAQPQVSGATAVLLGQPVDVNAASARELRAIPGVSRGLAEAIVEERRRGGPFADAQDLQRVPGIAARRAARLAPFVLFATARPRF